MTLTKHALERSQQRGIHQSDFNLIEQIGTSFNKPDHAIAYVVLKKDRVREIEYHKKMIQKIDKLEGTAIVVKGDQVLTTYHTKG